MGVCILHGSVHSTSALCLWVEFPHNVCVCCEGVGSFLCLHAQDASNYVDSFLQPKCAAILCLLSFYIFAECTVFILKSEEQSL